MILSLCFTDWTMCLKAHLWGQIVFFFSIHLSYYVSALFRYSYITWTNTFLPLTCDHSNFLICCKVQNVLSETPFTKFIQTMCNFSWPWTHLKKARTHCNTLFCRTAEEMHEWFNAPFVFLVGRTGADRLIMSGWKKYTNKSKYL